MTAFWSGFGFGAFSPDDDGAPAAPASTQFLLDDQGAYLVDEFGVYFIAPEE